MLRKASLRLAGTFGLRALSNLGASTQLTDVICFSTDAAPKKQNTRKLWAGNLPYRVKNAELRSLFSPYGVASVYMLKTKDGRSRGMCLIDVDIDKAEQAIAELHTKEFQGRTIWVQPARPREASAEGGGAARQGEPAKPDEPVPSGLQPSPAAPLLPEQPQARAQSSGAATAASPTATGTVHSAPPSVAATTAQEAATPNTTVPAASEPAPAAASAAATSAASAPGAVGAASETGPAAAPSPAPADSATTRSPA